MDDMKHPDASDPGAQSRAPGISAPAVQQSASALVVEVLGRENDAEVDAFLDRLGEAPNGAMVLGYHYPVYRDMLLEVLQPGVEACYLAARSAATGELRGILPGFMKHACGMSCYDSLPFFGPNVGSLAAAGEGDDYAGVARTLRAAAINHARGQGAITASFYTAFNPAGVSLGPPPFDEFPDVIRVERLTQYLDLAGLTEPNWPADIRYDLRKAHAGGVEVVAGVGLHEVDDLYEIYKTNCTQYGIPLKPRSCIEALVRAASSSRRIRTYSAKLAGRMIGALIMLWGPKTASYYLPCSIAEHRALQPGTLLIDHACRDALAHGIRYWNWESSPDRGGGVYRFKKKWGSIELPYRVNVVPLASLDPLYALGAEGIAATFPFFYVFPFDRLSDRPVSTHAS